MKKILVVLISLLASHVNAQDNNDSVKVVTEVKGTAKEKIEIIRKDIVSGKMDFTAAAKMYSQDPGSASKGGTYLKVKKGMFVPEFEAVAYSIKENTVSDIFETQYGFHILMVLERRGDEMDVRHILISK